jgi:hypothetical protein
MSDRPLLVSSATSLASPATATQSTVISLSGPPNSLWLQAASKLKLQVDLEKASKSEVLTDILSLAREKQESAAQKQWKITRRNGKVIHFRDVYGHIVSCVQKFREVGDMAVQYDPGHAALPWVAVCFPQPTTCVQMLTMRSDPAFATGKHTLRRPAQLMLISIATPVRNQRQ